MEHAVSGRSWDPNKAGSLFRSTRLVWTSALCCFLPTLAHSISRKILERLVRVAAALAWHLQHPFADDVALDLVGAAGDRAGWHRHQGLCQHPLIGLSSPASSASGPSSDVCMRAAARGEDAGRQLAEGVLGAR